MTNPLDGRNTKKQKKTKNKTADFFVNTHISVNFFQIFQEMSKQQYHFLEENPKITILFWVLVFSFMYIFGFS